MSRFEHEIGARVVVELSGKVIARHENERGSKYIVEPDDKRLPVVHAHPQFVFADDDIQPATNVVRFPRAEGEVA